MEYSLKELNNDTCRSFGGNNCVLHQCMFNCRLIEAKTLAYMREQGLSKEEAKERAKKSLM